MSSYDRYLAAEYNINEGLIRLGLSVDRPEGYVRVPGKRMDAMRGFLADCGNPQTGIPTVHVAGTSGKGSVSANIAGILKAAGLKVGLHISPYLQAATEKIWVDGRFVSADQFADLVDWVMPIARPWVTPDTPASIHGMASVAVALEGFRRAKVDVMVFEAGCGARFDLTSFVDTSVSVITNIGMDHVVSLGPTIEDIAWHKAGVARPGVPLVTGATGSPLKVIETEADSLNAPITHVAPGGDPRDHNRRVAQTSARLMGDALGVTISDEAMAEGPAMARLAGRTERLPMPGVNLFIDGAHNAEKLEVATRSALEDGGVGKKVAVIGFLGTKAGPHLLKPLVGRFEHFVATEPRVYGKKPYPAEMTGRLLSEIGFEPVVEPDPGKAVETGVSLAGTDGTVLVTGSFYLAGDVRNRWYEKRRVVLERTSWPQRNDNSYS